MIISCTSSPVGQETHTETVNVAVSLLRLSCSCSRPLTSPPPTLIIPAARVTASSSSFPTDPSSSNMHAASHCGEGCAHVRGNRVGNGHANANANHSHENDGDSIPLIAADNDTNSAGQDADHPRQKYKKRRRGRIQGGQSAYWILQPCNLLTILVVGIFLYWKWGISEAPAGRAVIGSSSSITADPKDSAASSMQRHGNLPSRVKAKVKDTQQKITKKIRKETKRLESLWERKNKVDQDDYYNAALEAATAASGGTVHAVNLPRSEALALQFAQLRHTPHETAEIRQVLNSWRDEIEVEIHNNVAGGTRWSQPYMIPSLFNNRTRKSDTGKLRHDPDSDLDFFRVQRMDQEPMVWQKEWKKLQAMGKAGPPVDYTVGSKYHYPDLLMKPPDQGGYPKMKTMRQLMETWPQDEDLHGTFTETLMHFNFSDPIEREAARKFRDAELPFKLYDIPEITKATAKWTDEYVNNHFRNKHASSTFLRQARPDMPLASGLVQESPSNFFAFYFRDKWDVEINGVPPDRDNDWNFDTWAQHANYADAAPLATDQPHFYWQCGVAREERYKERHEWTFISRDLPSWSSTIETFFMYHPDDQKGIQCRFGERGVVAATHYDAGRNMIAMVTGAKRYILSPPRECSKLGLFKERKSPIYRHSILNYGHILQLNASDSGMSAKESAWLERAATSDSIDTVLKEGEVLFIPSHWFHYIVSLQKSAQCNGRSGVDEAGSVEFGGRKDVLECKDHDVEVS